MTRDEHAALTKRLAEINQEISDLMPEFMKAGGSQEKARVDAAFWAQRLDPLFQEHHAIAQKLRRAAIEAGS